MDLDFLYWAAEGRRDLDVRILRFFDTGKPLRGRICAKHGHACTSCFGEFEVQAALGGSRVGSQEAERQLLRSVN